MAAGSRKTRKFNPNKVKAYTVLYVLPNEKLSVNVRLSSVVVVNFNEGSYTVAESDAQVSVSLRIDGQFFYPVWAIVEIRDGTATGGLQKCKGYKHLYKLRMCLCTPHEAHNPSVYIVIALTYQQSHSVHSLPFQYM